MNKTFTPDNIIMNNLFNKPTLYRTQHFSAHIKGLLRLNSRYYDEYVRGLEPKVVIENLKTVRIPFRTFQLIFEEPETPHFLECFCSHVYSRKFNDVLNKKVNLTRHLFRRFQKLKFQEIDDSPISTPGIGSVFWVQKLL